MNLWVFEMLRLRKDAGRLCQRATVVISRPMTSKRNRTVTAYLLHNVEVEVLVSDPRCNTGLIIGLLEEL